MLLIHILKKQQRLKDTVKVTIQFINYLIQDCLCGAITFNFPNCINALRQLILKIESRSVLLIDKEIDFDEECWTFINKYIIKNEDEDGDDDDKEEE